MPDFRIWGRIEEIAPGQFIAIASSVREDHDPSGVQVSTQMEQTREAAEVVLQDLVVTLGGQIRAQGGRIVDVETDGI